MYLSVGIYAMIRKRSAGAFSVMFFIIAACFLSGCLYAAGQEDLDPEMITDRVVLKLYVLSAVLPCILLRKHVYNDRPKMMFAVPALVLASILIITDVMVLCGYESVSYGILARCSVGLVLAVFCLVVYVSSVYGSAVVYGSSCLRKELSAHLLFLSMYNFLFLMYSFGLHVMLDYFLLVTVFSFIHVTVLAASERDCPLSSYLRILNMDSPADSPEEEACSLSDVEPRPGARDIIPDDLICDFDNDSATSLKDRLLAYFESEKPFLSKNISMEEVAMRLFTNKSYLSKTINVEMNKNFRELVNYFRVREAIKIYSSNQNISMNELRDKCGFNNNASFTSAFKLNTGMTPGEWCRDLKNKKNNGEIGVAYGKE